MSMLWSLARDIHLISLGAASQEIKFESKLFKRRLGVPHQLCIRRVTLDKLTLSLFLHPLHRVAG